MILFKAIFLKYILLPLVAFLLVGITVLLQKKEAVAKNKTLIIYVLLAALVLALPGIGGFAGNTFSPYWYLFVQLIYLALGGLHLQLLHSFFHKEKSTVYSVLFESTLTLLCMAIGAYLFTLLFNWINIYDGYAWIAVTSILIFPLPLVFYYSYLCFTAIPFEIYKVWRYDPYASVPDFQGVDFDKLLVLNLEFTKTTIDGKRFAVKAKAPADIIMGEWLNKFIEDYNTKYPQNRIEIYNSSGESFGWIFYIKHSFFHRRRYLDFNLTIAANKITENTLIFCKRVIQNEEEKRIDRRSAVEF